MLKLLVATSRGQGERPGDFCFAVDGELVYLGFVCARDQEDPDGGCGCGRAFTGLNSGKASTTAEVRELDLSEDDLRMAIGSSLEQAGWEHPEAHIAGMAEDLLELAEDLPVGVLIGRRLDEVIIRAV